MTALSAACTAVWREQPLAVRPGPWWRRSSGMTGVVPVAHALLALGTVAGLLPQRPCRAVGAVRPVRHR
ncbi:hypothetical protein LE181_22150 [Streptomyces sp. SCA3-4]|uniref:hypothetical protein n=1 Tax=Streptomyces sichuanensis TaxID=2871810 RepID=UPI001CE26537|nr:hypothetical protein [Streptomyces sichuanensis]MCA6094861.1 hypothetical protein [Streptomyces sichuanensis]